VRRSHVATTVPARGVRRGVVAALATLALLASVAAASTWGGRPATGRWSGTTKDQHAVSFKVTSGGRRVTRFKLAAQANCVDGDSGQPVAGIALQFASTKPLAVDVNGNFRLEVHESVPGVSQPVPFAISGGFTAHHEIPPPATSLAGTVSGGFTADDGDYCVLGGAGELDFSAHLHR
jgi:hypothetical protein